MSEDINDLQTRISFQEDLLQALNSRVAEQEKDIATLHIQLQHMNKKLKVLEGAVDQGFGDQGTSEVPPPHY